MKLYEIGAQIKKLRKEKGYTKARLAELAGISRVTLGKLERGEVSAVSIKTLDVILDAFSHEIEFKAKNIQSFGLQSLDNLAN